MHLARRYPARDVAVDALNTASPARSCRTIEIEPELGRVPPQVVVRERLLAVEEQLVHLPEPVLERGRLGRGGRREGVRVDLGQREVAEREPHAAPEPPLDPLDLAERLA